MPSIDIVTYSSGYSYDIFERFVGSLYDTGFSGNCFIIIRESDLPIINKLKNKYPKVCEFVDTTDIKINIMCHRYFAYRNLLKSNLIKSDYVFLCDFRDVIFQKNIEEYPINIDIDAYVFEEGKEIYKETICNIDWLLELEKIINEQFYDKIKYNYILCAGTSLFSKRFFYGYLEIMYYIFTNYKIKTNLDQAIHNYIIYMNKLWACKVKILNNKDNFVNTVGFDIHKIKDGFIVNSNDDISYIVHQYDRFSKEMLYSISNKYKFYL